MGNSSAGWLPFCANQLAIFDRGYLHGNERKVRENCDVSRSAIDSIVRDWKMCLPFFFQITVTPASIMEVRLFSSFEKSISFHKNVSFVPSLQREKKNSRVSSVSKWVAGSYIHCVRYLCSFLTLICQTNLASFEIRINNVSHDILRNFFQFNPVSSLQDLLMKLHEWIM